MEGRKAKPPRLRAASLMKFLRVILLVFINGYAKVFSMALSITAKKDRVNRMIRYVRLIFFNRKLLVTTKTLLKAIAPAASIGLSNPAAAAGIRMML